MADKPRVVKAARGVAFEIELHAAPGSTGYVWSLNLPPPGVALQGQAFQAQGSAPGAGGLQVFRLRASEPGRHRLRFTLQRAWETDPIEEVLVDVVVDG